MANTTSAFNPEVFYPKVQRQLHRIPVFMNLVSNMQFLDNSDRNLAPGDTVDIPNVASDTFTSTARGTLGSDLTIQDLAPANLQLSINQHYVIPFFVNNIEKKQSAYDIEEIYATKAARTMATTIDGAIYTALAATTNTAGSAGVGLTADLILQGNQQLDEANVDPENRVLVVSAQGRRELLNISAFINASAYGNNTLVQNGGVDNKRNYLGKIFGIDVYWSGAITGATSPTATNNILMHKDALAAVIQLQTMRTDYVPMKAGDLTLIEYVYGLKLLDVNKCVKLIS